MSVINSLAFIAVGLILGFVVGRLFRRSTQGGDDLQAQLDASRKELAAYREQVDEHFQTSAKLLEELAGQYQQIYHHMAQQSAELMSDERQQPGLFSDYAKLAEPQQEESDEQPQSAPRDYSNESSGLLKNQSNT